MPSHQKFLPVFFDYALIAVGAVVQAIGLRLFLVPANLASGGVSGISQLINHYTHWPIGLMVLIGNIPLFIIGWRFLGIALCTAYRLGGGGVFPFRGFNAALEYLSGARLNG